MWKFENGFDKNFKIFLLDKLNISLNNLNFDKIDSFYKDPNLKFDLEIIKKAVLIAYEIDYNKFYNNRSD